MRSGPMKPTFYEFFAGGGMARVGLEPDWQCVFANDIDPKKAATYRNNWGGSEFCLGDIHDIELAQLPADRADLAWASFPCQDLSLAGNGMGLDGERSGAFWGFHDLIHKLKIRRREPNLLVLENVGGAITSKDGKDFATLCRALKGLGYVYGALMIDAVHFVPQSRPRLFIVAVRSSIERRVGLHFIRGINKRWTTAALERSYESLRPDLRQTWRWWNMPEPPARNFGLSDLIVDDPTDVKWHSKEETCRLLTMMSSSNIAKVEAAKLSGCQVVGTIYKRTRRDENGRKVQRAEVRFDNISGCLRTPAGGSSRQIVIVVKGDSIRSRLLSAKEAAGLMGLSDVGPEKEYVLPANYNDAYHLLGDGLAVPVVRHLARTVLYPIVSSVSARPTLVAAE